jgi:hypothetical protein
MKKIQNFGLAVILAISAGSAQAGPALETLLSHLGDTVSFTAQSEQQKDGVEVYHNVLISGSGEGKDLELDALAVQQVGEQYLVSFTGGILSSNKAEMTLDKFAMTVTPDMIRNFDAKNFGETGILTPEMCKQLDSEFVLDMIGFKIKERGLTSVDMDHMRLDWDIDEPLTHCVMDLKFTMEGATFSDNSGVGLNIAKVDMTMFAPISDMIASGPGFETYYNSLSISDIGVGVGGQTQVKVQSLTSETSMSAASFEDLMLAGYTSLMHEASSSLAGLDDMDLSKFSPSELWNGLRTVFWSGSFDLKNAEIVGPMPLMMTGLDVFAPGRSLSLGIGIDKTSSGVSAKLNGSVPELVQSDVKLVLGMGVMDATADDMSRDQLAMSLPITFDEVKLSFHDAGLSEVLEHTTGKSLPDHVENNVSDFLGGVKSEIIGNWLRDAQGQEMTFHAKPSVGLPIPMLIGGVMGDWSAFSETLGVQ